MKKEIKIPEAKKITCTRCRGKGYLSGCVVVYYGAPGTCFMCDGIGEIWADKFHRLYGVGKKFFGLTSVVFYNEGNPNNGVFKKILSEKEIKVLEKEGRWDTNVIFRWVEITEVQARQFFKTYKEQHGYGVQVSKDILSDPMGQQLLDERAADRQRMKNESAARKKVLANLSEQD